MFGYYFYCIVYKLERKLGIIFFNWEEIVFGILNEFEFENRRRKINVVNMIVLVDKKIKVDFFKVIILDKDYFWWKIFYNEMS